MSLESSSGKQDNQKESLQKIKDAEKAALREMRDSISGEKLDYIDTKMRGTLNSWSQMEPSGRDVKEARQGFMRSIAMLIETAREEFSKEMRTPEDRTARRATLQKRFNDFANIAKKHGFDVEI